MLPLGPDGGGFDVMGLVVPWFQVLNAAVSVGIAEAAIERTAAPATRTRYEHLGQTLADQPVSRAHIARMRIQADEALALLDDTLAAVESGRDDAIIRVLEVKTAASEAAVTVTGLAMRVCGGAAFRKDVGVERNSRDARAATVMAPTTDALAATTIQARQTGQESDRAAGPPLQRLPPRRARAGPLTGLPHGRHGPHWSDATYRERGRRW